MTTTLHALGITGLCLAGWLTLVAIVVDTHRQHPLPLRE